MLEETGSGKHTQYKKVYAIEVGQIEKFRFSAQLNWVESFMRGMV